MSSSRTSIDLVAEPLEPLLQNCTICGAVLDVSDEEPLSEVMCPACGALLPSRRLLCPRCGLMAGTMGRFCKRCRTPLA